MIEVRVFIYGTLLPGQSNHHVAAPFIIHSEPGSIAARLVDAGDYPAAVRDSLARLNDTVVQGQWITIKRAGLAMLDQLEEFYGIEEVNDYERVWIHDKHNPSIQGWVYVWTDDRGCPSIKVGDWLMYMVSRH